MHDKELKDVFKELNSSEKGLSSQQAEERLHKYGLNELKKENGPNPLKIFMAQFTSPLILILMAALVISIFIGEKIDAIVIGVIVIINSVLGFVQEFKAERAIEALQRISSLKAKVIRDGQEKKIDSKMLVPGDLIVLETGDKVPADARIIEAHNLETQEAPLTGESMPVSKNIKTLTKKIALAERVNMVYAATIISKGRCKALITSTGMNTEVGNIAKLIQASTEKTTPLQKKLQTLGKYLTLAVVIVALTVFGAGVLSGQSYSEYFFIALALAVAAIPEGLPAVITISLALGVQKMVKRKALVRKLPAVETLGSVNVICTDKTGTLTHNEMTVTKVWVDKEVYEASGSGYEAEGTFSVKGKPADSQKLSLILQCGLLCNDAHFQIEESSGEGERKNKIKKGDDKNKSVSKINVIGDPTEAALIVSARKGQLDPNNINKKFPRVDEVPFTSERKMMTTIHKNNKNLISFTKGAPDIILKYCDKIIINGQVQRLNRKLGQEILAQNERFAEQALRVLGFAYSENRPGKPAQEFEQNMTFIGLQAMIDPPRREVKASIQTCKNAGIKVIMITGDQLATAQAIARHIGIEGKSMTGQELDNLKLSHLSQKIESIGVFARVNPEHKLKIIEALKNKNYVVAMTGDGINDAPALKKSDIGVSMGITGTDVAKEASDMILIDDNFSSIVNAVEEGRGIFDNIRKFVNYLLSCNLGEIVVILFASVLGLPLPLTAIQILWVNLITDGLPATALSLDPHSPGIMTEKPKSYSENILSKNLRNDILIFGGLIGLCSLALFWLYQNAGIVKAQSMVFTALVVFELVRLQTIRDEYKLKIFSNKWLVGAVVLSLSLHLLTLYTPANKLFNTSPLELIDWGVLIAASLVLLIVYRVIRKIINPNQN